jgi:hypothetical protein
LWYRPTYNIGGAAICVSGCTRFCRDVNPMVVLPWNGLLE